ncbi:unnamed protein product [Notodromas monacha]|uniref:Fe2OG dioxygenase domain-containing protein n=1 Tax=Notodromas monacha TaxID=399045 RepID=A0A7R9BF13_9CRUS|nr:unnamed protein product [Notodromas monacha]CAG0914187.1 unnamed protein product [Notodromas monacha]
MFRRLYIISVYFVFLLIEESQLLVQELDFDQFCSMNSTFGPSGLHCTYSTRGKVYLTLAPAKVEVVSESPEILIFHHVVGEPEIIVFRDLALPKLVPAMMVDEESGRLILSSERISNLTWLSRDSNPTIAAVTRRIGLFSGLNIAAAESFQVALYGIGGQFLPHKDFFEDESGGYVQNVNEMGDRVATWLMYLSDVEAGGSTVFPDAGVAVQPTKGSAVFWHNLLRNGHGDFRTVHGGCPVIRGSKLSQEYFYSSQLTAYILLLLHASTQNPATHHNVFPSPESLKRAGPSKMSVPPKSWSRDIQAWMSNHAARHRDRFVRGYCACLGIHEEAERLPARYLRPPKWPLLGNTLSVLLDDLSFHEVIQKTSKIYGPVMSMKFGQLEFIVLSDYDITKNVLAREHASLRPDVFSSRYMLNYENTGLILSSGTPWKEQRRFTLRTLRDFGFGKTSLEGIILDELRELVAEIRPEGISKDQPFVAELDSCLNAAVTNVIWWLVASKRVTKHDEEFKNILSIIEKIMDFGIINVLTRFPIINVFDSPTRINWLKGPMERREYFYSYMQKVLDEHRATLNHSEPRDLVDCYLIHQEKLGDSPDNFMTDNMIKASMVDLFMAGAETTSTTLRWFFLYIVEHPKVMSRIQDEIDNVIGSHRAPSYEDHVNMPYTTASIWELWRIVTITPMGVNRQTTEEMMIGGFRVPKGANIMLHLLTIHHNDKEFDSPLEFKPERFLNEKGKRQCLGESLARMNAFLAVVYLLQLFSFSKVPGETYSLRPRPGSFIINTPRAYKVLLTPRQ